MKKESKTIQYKQRTISVWNEVAPFYHKRWAKNEIGSKYTSNNYNEMILVNSKNVVKTGKKTKQKIAKIILKNIEKAIN